MLLTRHVVADGNRWAVDGRYLPAEFNLAQSMGQSLSELEGSLRRFEPGPEAEDRLAAPIESGQDVWASGVTYIRSRDARMAESGTKDVYDKVYDATRPELFWKASGWRVVGDGDQVRIRADSRWNVPEPELTLVINRAGEIVGYTVGNDMSSREIEGLNPLYLPQAKVYDGSCAIGPGIIIGHPDTFRDVPIRLKIARNGQTTFEDEVRTSQMKRTYEELAEYLCRELAFPEGAYLMTGTGIVPGDDFTLLPGDQISITVGELELRNQVAEF